MNICIYGAASNEIDNSYIWAGEALGKIMAENNHTLIFGGGANGMMGAVARGMSEKNGEIIGISPSFFNVDGVLFDKCTEMIYTETMSSRKALLEEKADAFIVTPGGIGTFDEFFETITLLQLKVHSKPIALYNINGYFNPMIDMLGAAVTQKFMPKENLDLFFVSDNPDELLEYLSNKLSLKV